jgi:hypothetical protein
VSDIDRDGAGRGGVDWDLLADHLGGALAGTPEQGRVAHLIATDPGWARAAARLGGALDAVAGDLHAVAPPPAMPDDVAARLDSVLRTLPPDPSAGIAGPPRPARPRRSESPGPPGHRPPARRPEAGPPSRAARRRRRNRWSALLAAAAGVAAFAAIGLGPLGLADGITADFSGGDDGAEEADAPADGGGDADDPAAPLEGAPDSQAEAAPDSEGVTRPPMAASGQNYQPGSPDLVDEAAPGNLAPIAPDVQQERPDQRVPIGGEVPDELATLWADPDPCLRAVHAGYRPDPVEIQLVDFARFEDRPALVIWLTADGNREVLVTGPDCGRSPTYLDERYRADLS